MRRTAVLLAFIAGCQFDLPDVPFCGDGTVAPYEACDDGNTMSGDGCDSSCYSDESCGNSILDNAAGEECDDGNRIDGDSCDSNCTITRCGNGIQTRGEACDDGPANSNRGVCLQDCHLARCGDGYIQEGPEECDQGAANANDGSCLANCQQARCGDGYVRGGVEECDDGNTITEHCAPGQTSCVVCDASCRFVAGVPG